MTIATFRSSWRLAALGAVATSAADGGIALEVVTPLNLDGDPAMALSFDRTPLARALRDSGRATLVCWDSRLAEVGWQPAAAEVTVDVIEDRDGDWVASGLLQQQLRTHPPSRGLLDTPLLRREHWWAMPRHIVRVTSITDVRPLRRRDGPTTGVLAWTPREGGGLHSPRVAVVTVDDWEGQQVVVRSDDGDDLPTAANTAALLASDVRTPDLDHTAELHLLGRLRDGVLEVEQRSGEPTLGPPPSLRRRMQAARRLERACCDALRR